jgi:type IV pilus assembly protein PilC
MKTYQYRGVDNSGRSVSGRMLAMNEEEMEARLRAAGYWLAEVREERENLSMAKAARRVVRPSRRELINFCVLMSFQLKVGIPMVTALKVAAEDCENKAFRGLLETMRKDVEAGQQLHEAMAQHGAFSHQFVSLVEAGEESGSLPDSFMELRRYLEWQEQIIADVRQATIYPAIVLLVVIAFVLILFTFVVPRFVVLLTAVKVALPLPTRIVFAVSDVAKSTWWVWMLLLIGGPLALTVGRRLSHGFAVWVDKVKFRLPLFGSLNHMLTISRFSRNLAILYRSGVNVVEAMKLTAGLVGSVWLGDCIREVAAKLEQGESISGAMKPYAVFPGLLHRMVVMGENTGQLDHALENVAEYYNLVVPRQIKRIFSVAEPALILFLVVVVGFVALAVFLPILGMVGAINK